MEPHPIRMVVRDDLERSRLTVFFRLLLAFPHFVWFLLWTAVVLVAAVITWLLTLIMGRVPTPLWRFMSSYVRYGVHLYAFVLLGANPFPGFVGAPGTYPIDVEIDPSERQNRWKTAFRGLLALPVIHLGNLLVGSATIVFVPDEDGGNNYIPIVSGVGATCALLAWFVCVGRARMPLGFRDLIAFALRFDAQVWGYMLFVTDRYPSFDPADPAATQPTPVKPIRIVQDDDLQRSRLTVFFRLLLALPHFVWLALWSVAVFVASIVGWFATLITGRLPDSLHRFTAAYLRYSTHVTAYVSILANPFPGFTGTAGSYPVDLEIEPPEQQNRWKTLFRLLLAIPAHLVAGVLGSVLGVVAVIGWFVGLVLGRTPAGVRDLGLFTLKYRAQAYGYVFLLTDSYPFAGPAEYVEPEPEPEPESVPTWPDAPPEPSF
jgi:hypothetical protein